MTPVEEQAKDKIDRLLLSKDVFARTVGIALESAASGAAQRGNKASLTREQLEARIKFNTISVEELKAARSFDRPFGVDRIEREIAARELLIERLEDACEEGGVPLFERAFKLPLWIDEEGYVIDAVFMLRSRTNADRVPDPFVIFWVDPY